ncbi:MAG TPA: molybdopterin dinucleotide binding domain-containing protein, partial [Candidatus Binatia bacterium]
QALRINRARRRGAKLIVIDPRKTTLAAKADCWLRVRPGTDGELAMAMIHVLIEEKLFDEEFSRRWTNAAWLVRCDNHQLLTERDRQINGNPSTYLVWDGYDDAPVAVGRNTAAALFGSFSVVLGDGTEVNCQTALQMLKDRAAGYAPDLSEGITTVPADDVRRAVRLFATEKPSSYCTWVGLEQDCDAMQTNRAVCCFYALTGQFDERGSNVLFAATPTTPITGRELLAKDKADRRLGIAQHPLGPPTDPGLVQAAAVYQAILTERPYPIKALVLFGSDPLLGHGDPLHGKAALEAVDFYIHVDTTLNPSATFADLVLPATTCWEHEALMPSFEMAEDTLNWAQLRPAVAKPVGESRSDMAIIFDLAQRLGLAEQFFNGDIEEAFKHQLAPAGIFIEELRENPIGLRANVSTRHRKYAEIDPRTGEAKGFETPTRKLEIYSTVFAQAGYTPLPEFHTRADDTDPRYPLTLTFYRLVQFCDEQHRNIPRLRRSFPEPFAELHPQTAKGEQIKDGEWISLETANGKVKLKAKFNGSLHPAVVAMVYGWWQACQLSNLSGYDPLSQNGANANLLIANSDVDPISASVAHRSQRCRIGKLSG